ncbi:MAG: type II toxin-antitoxin system PemK/MazF family toxin [Nanoarchaeota archaeon]
MEGLVRGDIIVIDFPYSDLSVWKRRPVFVVKVPKGGDILVCQITSESYEDSVEIIIRKEDFNNGSLKVESYLRMDKIFSVEKSLIKYKIGSLKKEKINFIIDSVCSFLKS